MEEQAAHRFLGSGIQVIRYLLDTNVISELRKTKPHGAVLAWMKTLSVEQIFLSAVTMAELQVGVELTRRQDAVKAREIESWLTFVETTYAFIPMDSACFREWARMMAGKSDALREDAMIAATARVYGFEVATRDEGDFKRLGVRIVNPFKAA
jgi:predicted nucleic acid-binding protein